MQLDLPITSNYVPSWGLWEAVREVIQNAKDEEEGSGNPMHVEYDGKALCVTNVGATMDRKALLIGHSTKTQNPLLRGQFGEGLNLAMLAAVRSGHPMVVRTPTETWTPTIENIEGFGHEPCLRVTVRARTKASQAKDNRSGIRVTIEMEPDQWLTLREKFMFLLPSETIKRVEVPRTGSILLDPKYKGHIFVKGIFVAVVPDIEMGYELSNMKLDRDRQMVNNFDLKWQLASMFQATIVSNENAAKAAYAMLAKASTDVDHFEYLITDESAKVLTEIWKEEHGNDAIPVTSIAESESAEHCGFRGVVAPTQMVKVVQKTLGTVRQLGEKITASRTYGWSDLPEIEREILKWAASEIDAVMGGSVLDRVNVVDFIDKRVQGLCTGDKIQLAKRILTSRRTTLTTLVHEEAHALSRAGDGNIDHDHAVEDLWARLYFARIEQ